VCRLHLADPADPAAGAAAVGINADTRSLSGSACGSSTGQASSLHYSEAESLVYRQQLQQLEQLWQQEVDKLNGVLKSAQDTVTKQLSTVWMEVSDYD